MASVYSVRECSQAVPRGLQILIFLLSYGSRNVLCTHAPGGLGPPAVASFLHRLATKTSCYKNARRTKTLTSGDKWPLFIIFVDLFKLFMNVHNT